MVFVVVPCHNEQKQIGRVVRGLFEHGWRHVVVVDDGSADNSAQIAAKEGAVVLRHEVNRGQGAALQTGNDYALARAADYIVHFDGDDQFNPADIATAIEKMRVAGADVAFGSRFMDGRSRVPRLKRLLILPLARVINRAITGIKLTDAHNGFRIFSRRAALTIRLRQDGMAHNTEIVAQVKKHGLACMEVPVEVRYYRYGQGVRGGIKILFDIFMGWTAEK